MTARTRVLHRLVVAVSLALLAWIVGGVLARQAHAQEFLSPEQAFRVRMTEERGAVVLHFAIADGYRLYGDRFRVASDEIGRAHV